MVIGYLTALPRMEDDPTQVQVDLFRRVSLDTRVNARWTAEEDCAVSNAILASIKLTEGLVIDLFHEFSPAGNFAFVSVPPQALSSCGLHLCTCDGTNTYVV